jgi:hypothetical protein
VIPNTIHMIYPVTDRTRPFSSLNVEAVKRAFTIHKPDVFLLWTNVGPSDIQHYSKIAGMVDLAKTDLPKGPDVYPQYLSDIMRLQILDQEGGIYMDTDMLTLKPYSLMLARRMLNAGWEGASRESVSNALMAAPPKDPFVREWLRRLPEAQKSPVWAYGGVVLPAEMSREPEYDDKICLYNHDFSCPLDLSKPWMTDPELKDEATKIIRQDGVFAVHVFESFWQRHLPGWERKDCLLRDLSIEAIKGIL